uniref:Preprotein translocase SecG subunit n=1 Tax=Nitzschia sp. PL1-4 TaxID=2083272 RepID=A0A2Z5ZAY7_9STRA|nr:Preprotein translocase SecG subunit [Nitzschia sp. PL1-4]
MLKLYNLISKIFLIINILIQFPLEKEENVRIKRKQTFFGSSLKGIYLSNTLTVFFLFTYLIVNFKMNIKK